MKSKHYLCCLTLLIGFAFQVSAGATPDSLRTELREGQMCILHQVEQGETLYGLSRRYGVSIQELLALNPESANTGIKIGQILVVPMGAKAIKPATSSSQAEAAPAASAPEQVNAPATPQRPESSPAGPGMASAIPKAEPFPKPIPQPDPVDESSLPAVFWHVLEEDETLFTLSQRYQIPLQDLLQANPELDPQQLKAGTRLRIPSKATAPEAPLQNPVQPARQSPESQAAPMASPRPDAAQSTLPTPASTGDAATVVARESAHPSARYHKVAPGETLYAIARQYPGTTPALLQSWNGLADNTLRSGQNLIVGWDEPKKPEPGGADAPPADWISNKPSQPDNSLSTNEEQGIVVSAAPLDNANIDANDTPLVRRSAKARGIATWIDATSPGSDNDAMLALNNDAPIGSWIEVRNLMNNRSVRAKVVGRLPQNLDDSRAIIKLSQGAARQLQAHDPKVLVEVVYTLP